MEVRRFKNLVGFQFNQGQPMGFHPERMEIAQLDAFAWEAMRAAVASEAEVGILAEKNAELQNNAMQDLARWNDEPIIEDSSVKSLSEIHDGPPPKIKELSLNLTQICNLRCTYCGAGDGSYGSSEFRCDLDLVEKQIRAFISRIPKGESFRLRFMGGEPLLYPNDLYSIARKAREIADECEVLLSLTVVTNGTRVSPAMAQFLGEQEFEVVLSWDGPENVQDKYRPTKSGGNSSQEVQRGLEELLKVRSQLSSLRVNSVMGVHNQNVKEAYHFLKSYNFDLYNFGFASSDQDEQASLQYALNMAELAEEVYATEGIQALARILPFSRFLRQLDQQEPVKNFCEAGKSFVHSDTKGQLYACSWFSGQNEEKIGEVADLLGSRSTWLKPLTRRHHCGSCWARTLCGGGCAFVFKTKTGSTERRDDSFCDRTVHLAAISVYYYGIELSKRISYQGVSDDGQKKQPVDQSREEAQY